MEPVGSATEEVARALERIADLDTALRAVCDVDPTAVEQAERLDAELRGGRRRSPLHGRPVLVKDNIDTAGLASTAGSLALAGSPPAADAPVVRRLREAGMVVLGKTNLSEWANIRDEHSTSGWSAHGGLTRNPYALNRTAWGSSSGSGAAVAARLAPYALGTETMGSITAPSAACGCVGLKPTVGLLPTEGIVPISWSMDAPGPMALTVREVAALLGVLVGSDPSDPSGFAAAAGAGVTGRRIGVPRASWGYSAAADTAAERALSLLSAAGAEIVDDCELPALAELADEAVLTVMLTELGPGLASYLAARDAGPRSLADIVAFNRAHAADELGWFGQGLLERALELEGPESAQYADALAACRRAGAEELERVLRDHRLDALLAPSTAPATPIDLVNGDHYVGGADASSALAGAPILTVPVELVHGLPVAVSLWGPAHSEATLLAIGAALEQGRDATLGALPEPTYPDFV